MVQVRMKDGTNITFLEGNVWVQKDDAIGIYNGGELLGQINPDEYLMILTKDPDRVEN